MATGKMPVTPKLLTSFVMPDNFRAFGIAPVSEDRAWAKIITWPVVVLIDTTGQVHQTGYAYKELKDIREKYGLHSMLEVKQAMCLEGHTITSDDNSNCFILSTQGEGSSIHHIDRNGDVSTVLSNLLRSLFDNEGLAYLIHSPDREMVLFGDGFKGIRSVKWPRNRLARMFLSPTVESFYAEQKDSHSIAVDKKSDLICMSTSQNKIVVISKKCQKISEYVGESSEKVLNQHVIFDQTGCILVFNSTNSLIFRISPDGQFIQTLFPEKKESKICEDCKKLKTPPKCRECKDSVIITTIGIYEDILWVCRLSGEV